MDNQNNSKSDIISNMPSDIIDNILCFLPINEAVKTSILSKKWRFKWRYLSKLVFDDIFYQTTSVLHSTEKPDVTKLFSNIYKVLLLHHGPILNFTFHVPLLENYPEINHLFVYLSEKDVQEISFDIGRKHTHHRLPSFLFSCVTLRSLTLSSCSVTVPLGFPGFRKLIFLELHSVHFNTNGFETLISNGPLLETLSIKDCTEIDNIHIESPYLKFFHFSGSLKSICFRKTSRRLSTFIFDGYFMGNETSELTMLFECLTIVEHLHLGSRFFMYPHKTMPRKLSATLNYLRVFELPGICLGCTSEVSAVLWLIMSSPNLEKLEIVFDAGRADEDFLARELLKLEDRLSNALKKLRVVKMRLPDIEVVKAEMEFIKFLLAESVVLEKFLLPPWNERF